MIPDEEQQEVLDSITDETEGSLIAGDMGTGKTLLGTEIIKKRKDAQRVLIICPKSTVGFATKERLDGWVGTLVRQGVTLPIYVVKNRSDLPTGPFIEGIWIINREAVAAYTRETKKQKAYDWEVVEWDVVIYDEIHYISNRKSSAYKTASKIKAKLRIGLSGTPFRTKFSGMWSVTRWIWPEKVRSSFWAWAYKWCAVENQTIFIRGNARTIRLADRERTPGQYVAKLPNYHRLTRPKLAVFKRLGVDLTPEQRKIYQEMQDKMLARVEAGILVADLPITQRLRLREITLGVPNIEESEEMRWNVDKTEKELKKVQRVFFDPDAKSSKLDALEEYLEGHPAEESPLVVFTHSRRFAKVVAHRFPDAELWDGDTTDQEREDIKKRFFSGKSHMVIATVDAFGTGTDGFQDRASTVIFLSRTESPTDNEQAIGRLDRRGQNKESVLVIDIVARDTYDAGQLMEHGRKSRDTQASMKGKK